MSKKSDKKSSKSKSSAKPAKADKKASKKPAKAPKPATFKMAEDKAAEITGQLFKLAKKMKKAGSEKDAKKLHLKALGLMEQVTLGTKKGQYPRLDKAYNRCFDRIPADLVKQTEG